jgi:hypothetical protein
MNRRLLRILVLLAVALFAGNATAAHTRLYLGFHFGVPLYWPEPYYYYPPPYYYYPPPSPPVYYAPAPAAAPEETQQWYYFCADSKTYYPYVRECPAGWQRVPAVPPR